MSFIAGYLLGLEEGGGGISSGPVEILKNAETLHTMQIGGGYELRAKWTLLLNITRTYEMVDDVQLFFGEWRYIQLYGCLYKDGEFLCASNNGMTIGVNPYYGRSYNRYSGGSFDSGSDILPGTMSAEASDDLSGGCIRITRLTFDVHEYTVSGYSDTYSTWENLSGDYDGKISIPIGATGNWIFSPRYIKWLLITDKTDDEIKQAQADIWRIYYDLRQ